MSPFMFQHSLSLRLKDPIKHMLLEISWVFQMSLKRYIPRDIGEG